MVILFCGIPGCGKSTIARLLAKELKKRGKTTRLFIGDDIKGRVYKNIPKILKENLGKADFLILDATFYKKKWRDQVFTLAKPHRVSCIFIQCKKETAIKRNKRRKPALPEKVIHIMAAKFEKPRFPHISINTDSMSSREALHQILSHFT